MAITDTLVTIKDYFMNWHTTYFDQLHQRINNSITSLENTITNINDRIIAIQNNFDNYYTKTQIDNTFVKKNDDNWITLDSSEYSREGAGSDTIVVKVNPQARIGVVHVILKPITAIKANKLYEYGNTMTLPSQYHTSTAHFWGVCSITAGNEGGHASTGVLRIGSKSAGGKIGFQSNIGWAINDARDVYGTIWWRW